MQNFYPFSALHLCQCILTFESLLLFFHAICTKRIPCMLDYQSNLFCIGHLYLSKLYSMASAILLPYNDRKDTGQSVCPTGEGLKCFMIQKYIKIMKIILLVWKFIFLLCVTTGEGGIRGEGVNLWNILFYLLPLSRSLIMTNKASERTPIVSIFLR